MTEYMIVIHQVISGSRQETKIARRKPTAEEVKKNNLRMAKAKLRMLIDNNFKEDDYYFTLTFKKELLPEEVKRQYRNS